MFGEPVRIGVIGCGGYAFHMIQRIASQPQFAQLAAVACPVGDEPGVPFCRDRQIPLYRTVDRFLAAGGFEVVYLPAPIHLHGPLAKRCLEAGYAVWMEKPPLATVQELDEVSAFARECGQQVAVCFNSLFSETTQWLKEALVSGRLGQVKRVKGIGAWVRDETYFSRNNWAGKLQLDGRWILDGDVNNPFAHVLCNNLFFASAQRWELAKPASIQAELYRCHPIESEDTSCLRILTADGVEILNWLTLAPESEIAPRTEIETDLAHILYDDFKRLEVRFKDGRLEVRDTASEDRLQMIEQLCRAYRENLPYHSTLEMVRPFTVAVNGAFESAGQVSAIPMRHIRKPSVDPWRHEIRGINAVMIDAHSRNVLFSEMGIAWGKPGIVFALGGYHRFPVRFEVGGNPSKPSQIGWAE